MNRTIVLAALAACLVLGFGAASAAPRRTQKAVRTEKSTKPRAIAKGRTTRAPATRALRAPAKPLARVSFGSATGLRPAADAIDAARRAEPLTAEETAAAAIQKLLRGPLRAGVTGLLVADARTGEPLFSANADDPLNPASNVKLISTAAALELLGPEFKYPTRVLGPSPVGGVIRGDIYLLGSHDPTLVADDLEGLAAGLVARGVTAIEGSIVVGRDPTRDGLFRPYIPVEIAAGQPGAAPAVMLPPGMDLVSVKVTATTSPKEKRSRLTYREELITDRGQPRISLTIGGTIGKDAFTTYPVWTRQRTAAAAYTLLAALRMQQVAVAGEMRVMELGDFVDEAADRGVLPVELARHESQTVAALVARINKRSINWLADRLIMTAAALTTGESPSMARGIDAMYAWLARHPRVAKSDLVIDTGSGLSYNTQISSQELVSIVRSAGGFVPASPSRSIADAWLRSLSVAGSDGTLAHRFRGTSYSGHILGKTGTLSTAIAIAGVLDVDPERPLAFALVTNTDAPLSKPLVRSAHDQVIREICNYIAKTRPLAPAAPPVPAELSVDAPAIDDDRDAEIDLEAN